MKKIDWLVVLILGTLLWYFIIDILIKNAETLITIGALR